MAQKHKYKQDYKVEEVKKRGLFRTAYKKKLVYKGSYYSIQSDKTSVTSLKWTFLAMICFITAVFLGIGLLNNEGSRKIYIIIPYAFMFLPIFYGMMGTVKFLQVKGKMTLMEYEHTVERIKKCSLSLVILAIATAIGEVIFMISNKIKDVNRLEYAFFGGIVVIGGFAMILLQMQKRYEIVEEKNP